MVYSPVSENTHGQPLRRSLRTLRVERTRVRIEVSAFCGPIAGSGYSVKLLLAMRFDLIPQRRCMLLPYGKHNSSETNCRELLYNQGFPSSSSGCTKREGQLDSWSSRRQVALDQLARFGVGLRVRSWESQTRSPALFPSKKSLLIAHSCRLSSLFPSTSPSRYTHIHIHNMSTYALPESHRDVSTQCALQIQARVLTMSSSWRSLSSRLTLRSPRS